MTPNPLDGLDLTLDVATLLPQATAAAHEAVAHSKGAGWLTRGELDKDEYVRFLIMLWHVYSTLEVCLEQHAAHPVLAPTHSPALLARAPALSADIAHLLAVAEPAWPAHPLARAVARAPPAPLAAYTARIRAVAAAPDPSGLLAHAYVRYLGDLGGGQLVRRTVGRAYALDAHTGLGTQFYAFGKLGGGGAAGVGDVRSIKAWYREGMVRGVGDDEQRKVALVSEANTAFQLNGAIFDSLRAPSTSKAGSRGAAVETTAAERTVSVAGIVSLLVAMGIAHFALVTAGFFGEAGTQKWDSAMAWVGGVFGISATA